MTTCIVCIRHAKPLSEGYAEGGLYPLSDEGRNAHLRLTEKLETLGI